MTNEVQIRLPIEIIVRVGSIEVGNPWTRATPRGAPVAVVYMTITNKGSVADRLVGGSTAVAGRFEVHNMVTEDGVAKMRPRGSLRRGVCRGASGTRSRSRRDARWRRGNACGCVR